MKRAVLYLRVSTVDRTTANQERELRDIAGRMGCEIVKVFPGSSVGGPEFVKNVMGPMPWTRIMPTGGVEPTEESLRKWFGAGIVACGIGSNLITKELLAKNDYAGIEARVRDTVKLIKMIRGK